MAGSASSWYQHPSETYSKANFDGFTSRPFSGFPQSQSKDLEFQAMTTFSIFQSPMLIAAFGPS
jgi:hypothetical protein